MLPSIFLRGDVEEGAGRRNWACGTGLEKGEKLEKAAGETA